METKKQDPFVGPAPTGIIGIIPFALWQSSCY